MSTLKEKLLQVADDLEKEAFNYPKMRTMDVVNLVLRKLANKSNDEQITDDYAIEFYCWMVKVEEGTIINKEYANQLLTAFKKEKGL
jgi:hypothetical protein